MRGLQFGLHWQVLASLVLTLCSSVNLGAQAPAAGAEQKTSEPGKTVSFALAVLDRETGQPVPGAKVAYNYFVRGQRTSITHVDPQQSTTDENGKITLFLPQGILQHFGAVVTHSNYATRSLGIQGSETGIQNLPAQYTLNLHKGVTVGGMVKNEKGEGVPGAKVMLWGYGRNPSEGPNQNRPMEVAVIERNETNAVVSDAKGYWAWRNVPAELTELFVEVLRPGGAVTRFGTVDPQRYGLDNASEISLASLRATNAVLLLKEGITVRGVVVDSAGKPVPGARLRERSVRSGFNSAYTFTNQPDGRFELRNRTPGEIYLTAEAEGYAIDSTVVTPAAEMKEVRLVLPRPVPLRLRVLGANSEPVADAEVRPLEWRVRRHVLDWRSKTDSEGRVTWSNAPKGELTFVIASSEYPPKAVRVVADGAEHPVVLEKDSDKKIKIKIKATDAESGQPLAKFEVHKGQEWDDRFEKWDGPVNNGLFEKELVQGDFRNGYVSSFRLQVRAEGYLPWSSETLYFDEGSQELAVKLSKGSPLAATVLQPNGQPAENAQVILNTSRNNNIYLNNNPADIYLQPGMFRERTGPDGKFRFEPADAAARLVITHPAGFASKTVQEVPRGGEVRLQPWGRIEGVLEVLGKPRPNEQLSLRYPLNWSMSADFSVHHSARTDPQGRFAFTNLPPGHYLLYRQPRAVMGPITESHRVPVVVKAGEVTQLTYSFKGRTVIGHVDADATVDWQNDSHVLVAKVSDPPPAPSYYAYGDQKAYEKARQEYARSPEVLEHERKRNNFQLVFSKDGDFRVEDVPPGVYDLKLRVTRPPEDKNMRYRGGPESEKVIGTLTREITVPPGKQDEEFDLGSLELQVTEPTLAAASPLSLQAVKLDGQPFDLASTRGRPVVLLFWADFAFKSKAQLDLAKAAQSQVKGATFVTLSLDEDPAVAAAGVKQLVGPDWVHVRLTGSPRAAVCEELSIDTLPMIFVLDEQGRPTARDVEGKRLRAALQRVAARTAKK